MSIRLNKALRNLNISLKTATDFLLRHKELGEIREEPSFKLNENQYEASAQQLLCGWQMLQSRRQTLMILTTSIVYSDNFQSFIRCLFIHNKQSSHISMTQLIHISAIFIW